MFSTDIAGAKAARASEAKPQESIAQRQQRAAERRAAKYDTPIIGADKPDAPDAAKGKYLAQDNSDDRSKGVDKTAGDGLDHSM